ncbi:MAG: hypothetical protein ACOVOV_09885 [Dolichospermum sp.]
MLIPIGSRRKPTGDQPSEPTTRSGETEGSSRRTTSGTGIQQSGDQDENTGDRRCTGSIGYG